MSGANQNELNVGVVHGPSEEGTIASVVQFPFHGTCRNCNHLHHGNVISVPTDQKSHSRVSCERCHYVMFGLGRNSTQTTLASVSTASLTNTLLVREPRSCSELPPCGDDIDDLNTSDQYSDAPRDNDLPRGVDSKQESERLDSVEQPYGEIDTEPNGDINAVRHAVSPSKGDANHENGSPVHNLQVKHATIKKRFINFVKYRVLKRSRRAEKPESEVEATKVTNTKNPAILTNSETIGESPPSQVSAPSQRSEHINDSSSRTFEPAHAEPDETTLSYEHASRTKKERLRVKRREATLRKRQLRARKCYCSENCHCFRNAGKTASSSRGSVHTSVIPNHPLGDIFFRDPEPSTVAAEAPPRSHSPERHVAFAGTQFDAGFSSGPPLSVVADDTITRRPSRISSSTRTSQATTAIDSRSSEARAAIYSAPRAMSLPGLHEFVQVVENSRPAVLEYLRNFDRLGHQNTNRSTVDTRPGQQEIERESSLSLISQDSADVESPPRASATSLSHLPDPSDIQTDDDTSPLPLSSPTTGQGSNVRTPQIRSASEGVPSPPPQPGPDEVSLALQALSEEEGRRATDVTDFGAAA